MATQKVGGKLGLCETLSKKDDQERWKEREKTTALAMRSQKKNLNIEQIKLSIIIFSLKVSL